MKRIIKKTDIIDLIKNFLLIIVPSNADVTDIIILACLQNPAK
jgi:hypothetical protein